MAWQWDESMSTGDAELDRQHKLLIQKLNELVSAMANRQADAELGKLMDFLEKYVVKHFSEEEAVMDQRKCPAAAANRQAHAQFVKRFGELKAALAQGGATSRVVIDTMRELGDWLPKHIKAIDAQLARA